MGAPIVNVEDGNWSKVRRNFNRIKSVLFGPDSTPTFATITLGDLTASRLMASDADKALTSADLFAWVAGTANEIDVADDGDGTITIGLVNPLIVGKGGTGAATLTDHGILIGSGTDAITALGEATNGQLVIGSTGFDPVLATLTGTANRITVTEGAGSITLSAPQDLHTGASPQFASLELGHVSDTTITRVSAGVIAVEGVTVALVGGAPTAHTHDGDTLQLDGVNSDGGAFSFTTSGTVTFSEAITMSTGKDLTIAGHIIFNTNNSYIGFASPRITFNDNDNTLDVTGNITMLDDATIGLADGTPSILFDDTLGKVQINGSLTVPAGTLSSGVDDTTRGYCYLYAGATGFGGSLYLNVPANSDDTINAYAILTYEDDLRIGTDVDGDIITITAGSAVGITTTLGVTGAVTWSGGGSANANTAYSHSQLVAGNPHSVTPTELGLVIGTNTQAWGAVLDDLNSLGAAASDGQFIVATGAGAFAYESGDTARISMGVGSTDSPSFTNLTLTSGQVTLGSSNPQIHTNTAEGSDNARVQIGGGGLCGYDRGGYLALHGNTLFTTGGQIELRAGNVATGDIKLYTGNAVLRFSIDYDGTAAFSSALTALSYNGLTLTAAATGFTTAGGTTPKTLTVDDDFVVSTQLTAIGSNTSHRGLTSGNPHQVTPTELSLLIGTNVQAWDAQLDDIAALAHTNGNIIVGDGSNWVAESGDTARISMGVGSTDSPTFVTLDLTGVSDGRVPYVGPGALYGSYLQQAAAGIGVCTGAFTATCTLDVRGASSASDQLVLKLGTHVTDRAWKFTVGKNAHATYGNYPLIIQPYVAGNSGDFVLDVQTGDVLLQPVSGKVGVNTTSPDTVFQVVGDCKFGDDNTNYVSIGTTGDITFTGSAGFYPRVLDQTAEPAAGTGATQCDTGEAVIWTDTDDAKCYLCYNHGGTVKTVELA